MKDEKWYTFFGLCRSGFLITIIFDFFYFGWLSKLNQMWYHHRKLSHLLIFQRKHRAISLVISRLIGLYWSYIYVGLPTFEIKGLHPGLNQGLLGQSYGLSKFSGGRRKILAILMTGKDLLNKFFWLSEVMFILKFLRRLGRLWRGDGFLKHMSLATWIFTYIVTYVNVT